MSLLADITLSPEAYQFLTELVYERSRIRLGPDKQAMVVFRLTKRLRQLNLESFEEYCDLLQTGDGAELEMLVDFISTNHTRFFREMEHFEYLENTALPELSQRLAKGEPLRIWSSACSSGQEPYSIAIVLAEYFRLNPDRMWRVEATDISTRMLERARKGVYPLEDVRLPGQGLLQRYFQKGIGEYEGQCRVKEPLRQRVVFHHLNLLEGNYPVAKPQHIIFCRNVMIYFDQPTQQELINRLVEYIAPDGWLIVGHSESLLGSHHALQPVIPGVYRHS
jgi:chemotaxis protein methyltransferase CheR